MLSGNFRSGRLRQGTPGAGRIGHVRGEGGSEGRLRQLRVRDALGRRDGGHQGFMGRREGALVFDNLNPPTVISFREDLLLAAI